MEESEDQSGAAGGCDEDQPPPEDEEELVVDHVEGQHADRVHVGLAAARAPAVVVTRGCGHTGEVQSSITRYILHLSTYQTDTISHVK